MTGLPPPPPYTTGSNASNEEDVDRLAQYHFVVVYITKKQ